MAYSCGAGTYSLLQTTVKISSGKYEIQTLKKQNICEYYLKWGSDTQLYDIIIKINIFAVRGNLLK